jgi:hypothetical protein
MLWKRTKSPTFADYRAAALPVAARAVPRE